MLHYAIFTPVPTSLSRASYRWPLLIGLTAAGATSVLAQAVPRAADRPVYTTQRLVGEAPVVDGTLDDAAWEEVAWSTTEFHQRQPDDAAMASEDTRFKILYDARFLYVAWRAFDKEPELVEARLGAAGRVPGRLGRDQLRQLQ